MKRIPQADGAKTRRKLLDLLKREGPADPAALARRLGVSAMAVRLHLYELRRGRLAAFREAPRGRGRPSRVWSLTPRAARLFPDSHGELAAGLLSSMRRAFGRSGLDRLVRARAADQAAAYRLRIAARAPLAEKVRTLARIRTEEGYLAEPRKEPDGALALVENHCPICIAATACQGLCGAELEVFRKVLGPGAKVERTEHLLAGSRRCVYRITPTGGA